MSDLLTALVALAWSPVGVLALIVALVVALCSREERRL